MTFASGDLALPVLQICLPQGKVYQQQQFMRTDSYAM
jgi:hypothetical protein